MNVVYKYALLAPTQGQADFLEQLFLANRFRNESISILKERREGSRQLGEESAPPQVKAIEEELRVADATYVALQTEVKKLRSATRKRTVTTSLQEAAKAQRDIVVGIRLRLKKAREEHKTSPEVIKQRTELRKVAKDKTAEAYSKIKGLHWGTRRVIDMAMEQADKTPLYENGQPNDPKYRRWTGEGILGLSLHQVGAEGKGFSVQDLLSGSNGAENWVRIRPSTVEPAGPSTEKVAKHRARNAKRRKDAIKRGGGNVRGTWTLSVRIGTNADRTPKMVDFPMIYHRELPSHSLITNLRVTRRKVGPRSEYHVCFNVKSETILKPSATTNGTVAVDLGWSVLPNNEGILVARWMGSDGDVGFVQLDNREPVNGKGGGSYSAFKRAETLRQTRDLEFNKVTEMVLDFFQDRKMPDWLRRMTAGKEERLPSQAQATATMRKWHQKNRMILVLKKWLENRIPGDTQILEALERWRYRDFHLWSWESNQSKKAIRRRTDIYRSLAASLGKKYAKIIVHDTNYLNLKRAGDEAATFDAARARQQIASPGDLRETLRLAFESRGGVFEKVPVDKSCPSCKNADPESLVVDNEKRMLYCHQCLLEVDIDSQACYNLLHAAGHSSVAQTFIQQHRTFTKKLKNEQQNTKRRIQEVVDPSPNAPS